MNRRMFLTMALGVPALGQAGRPEAQKSVSTRPPAPKPAPSAAASAPQAPAVPWTQWGGPARNFHAASAGLRDTWAPGGPPVVWRRALGDGYSSVIVDGERLYTAYGRRREEVVIAANAGTGETLWEHVTPVTFDSQAAEMGNGPYATPLLSGGRLFTAGVAGQLQCVDAPTGKLLWTQQLWSTHGGSRLAYGYASSPIAFRELVIVPVGGRGKSIMAFRQADGAVAWSRHDFGNAYSSPVLIDVDGLEQLAILMDGAVVAVNPHNGDMQWQVPFKADYAIAVATPVWGPDRLLFVSSEYNGGAKVIELQRNGLQTRATELWHTPRLRLHHGNAIRVEDTIYLSSGGKGSQAILSAVDARSGTIRWQERSIEKATFVCADRKLIVLDQDGNLMIAHPSPQTFKVSAKAPLLSHLSWTPPTLVGTRAYIRDRRTMMAVELG